MSVSVRLLWWVISVIPNLFTTYTLSIFLITLLAVILLQQFRYMKSLPPGPFGYPILGILPFIKKEFHLLLFDYANKFGKVISFKMGNQLVVVISDHNIIKKAFAKSEFAARPKTELGAMLGGYGIINAEGALWKSQRKFLHQQKFGMKHWGSGSEVMESRISEESCYFLSSIAAEGSKPVNPSPLLNCAVSNVICSIVMSTRFNANDPKFKRFMHLFDEGFRLYMLTGAMTFIPILKHLPGISSACQQLMKNRDEMLEFVRYIVLDHKATLDVSQPRDLVDSYLIEIEKASATNTTKEVFECDNPEIQLEQVLLDIFSAGVETLKTTLQWAILFMVHNPEVRKKVQQEMDGVVGSHRLPTMEDMSNLPYTKATIYEVMRRSTVVPMGTTHATSKTVELEGHIIPKNSHVIPLLHAVHMDPEVWDQPESFRPERFLTAEGTVQKPKHFMPFGAGQRMCLGDTLAEMELQLFFTSLLHVYDIENPGTDLPSLKGTAGVTVTPQDYEVNFVPRNVEALINSASKSKHSSSNQHIRLYG